MNPILLLFFVIGMEAIAYVLKYRFYLACEERGEALALTYQAWLRQLIILIYIFLVGGPLLTLFFPLSSSPAINAYAPLPLRLAGACLCVVGALVAFCCGLPPYLKVRRRESPGKAAFHLFEYLYVLYITLVFLPLLIIGGVWLIPVLFHLFTAVGGILAYILLLLAFFWWLGCIWVIYVICRCISAR